MDPSGQISSLDHELACLSQRMPIEFFSVTSDAREQEQKQVESHMRVCLKVLPGFRGMVTVSPSEPILSEAAYQVMSQNDFNAPKALKEVMSGFSVNKGDRGEFAVMLLFTLARDAAVRIRRAASAEHPRVIPVVDFLTSLFINHETIISALPSMGGESMLKLEAAFANSRIHFNHFIKVHQHAVINRKYLLWLLSRGAAVLCGNSQAGIDGIVPFVFRDSHLQADNIGVILWQSKADRSFSHIPKRNLFDKMDPFKLGIFDESDAKCIPVIRIVFALLANTASVKVLLPSDQTLSYPAYDIWCSGISATCLTPVQPHNEDIWKHLVEASCKWEAVYKVDDSRTKELRMTMNPGIAIDQAFWKWTTLGSN